MKIITIIGARPQFIKCAPLSAKLRREHDEILVHTGQHYDVEMSDVFFNELNIPKPDYNLGIGSGNHGEQTGKILIEIEKILNKEKPDLVLVYGDTNSTLAGALAAVKMHIKLIHIEAGLRSFDRRMPEEINRVLTDHASDILFCPTQIAVDNLKNEGINNNVYLVGDVMLDALKDNLNIAEKKSMILQTLGIKPGEYLVATIHRPSNTDNVTNLTNIVDAFCNVDFQIVFPVHPRTEKMLKLQGLWTKLSDKNNIIITKPLGYLDMIYLISCSAKIVTDSGGIQKEAYVLKVPCITLRENTEWIETIKSGKNILVESNKNKIIEAICEFNPDGDYRDIFAKNASKRMCDIINSLN